MPPTTQAPDRLVVLLGGVNVGGHRLAMPALRAALEAAGCTDVVTYIRSGNAVVTPPTDAPPDLAAVLGTAVSDVAAHDVPAVLRTGAELADVVAANPYPDAGGTHLHVVFFARPQPATVLDGIDLPAFLPEECTLLGRELYLHLPHGMGRAALPAALSRRDRRADPPETATSRNWNTVTRLLELARR